MTLSDAGRVADGLQLVREAGSTVKTVKTIQTKRIGDPTNKPPPYGRRVLRNLRADPASALQGYLSSKTTTTFAVMSS